MKKLFPINSITLVILSSLAAAQSAQAAQSTEAQAQEIERIVVTTQKRVQSIQDVPVTVTAFTGEFLEQLGINELDVLSEITPGLIIQEQSPNNPGFVIRGITSDSGSAQATPRVSVYYNGVDISRSRGSYFEMFDIERVEVVKGPQATLFGTAASVGAIAITTRKPEEEFSAGFTLGAGNYNMRTASGFVTGGNPQVQGRLALNYRQRDGYIKNINPQQDDMNGLDRIAVRPSLRFTPHYDVTIDVVYNYERNQDPGTSFKNGLFAPTGGDTSPYSFVELSGSPFSAEVLGAEKLGLDRTVEDINVTAQWEINDNWTLTSITGHRSFDSLEIFDADGTQAWFLEFAEDAQGDQFSQELRFSYTSEKMNAFFGASYFKEDGFQRVPFSTEESIFLNCLGMLGSGLPCVLPDGSVPLLTPVLTGGALQTLPYAGEFANYGENRAISVFADVAYNVSDALELTAGIRFVDEDRESGFSATMPNSVLAGIPLLPVVPTNGAKLTADGSYNAWLPRFNALYRVNNDVNLYATIAKGRRAEVLDVVSALNNGTVVPGVTEVPAEIIWNYEAGIKGSNAANSLRYSASIFYQDYDNFQVTRQDDAGNFFTDNAGAATNVGIEAEVRGVAFTGFEWFANLAWIDAKIDSNSANGELAGNRFRLQPELAGSFGFFYKKPLSNGLNLSSALVQTYRSEVFFEEDNAPVMGLDIKQGPVQLTSIRLGVEHEQQQWSLMLFANNLFNKEYLVDAGNTGASFSNPTFIAGTPRFVGVELSKRF